MPPATEEERHDPDRSGALIHERLDRLVQAGRKVVEIRQFDRKLGRCGAKAFGD
jgi:hypothetical protein